MACRDRQLPASWNINRSSYLNSNCVVWCWRGEDERWLCSAGLGPGMRAGASAVVRYLYPYLTSQRERPTSKGQDTYGFASGNRQSTSFVIGKTVCRHSRARVHVLGPITKQCRESRDESLRDMRSTSHSRNDPRTFETKLRRERTATMIDGLVSPKPIFISSLQIVYLEPARALLKISKTSSTTPYYVQKKSLACLYPQDTDALWGTSGSRRVPRKKEPRKAFPPVFLLFLRALTWYQNHVTVHMPNETRTAACSDHVPAQSSRDEPPSPGQSAQAPRCGSADARETCERQACYEHASCSSRRRRH